LHPFDHAHAPSDEDDRRSVAKRGARGERKQVEPGREVALFRKTGALDHHHRSVGRQAGRDQARGDQRCRGLAHVDRQRRLRIGERPPVEVEIFAHASVRGDESQPPGKAAQRQRHPEAGRGGAGSGDTRTDLHCDAGGPAGVELLGRPAEDRRIAALEPHHSFPGKRGLHEQQVDRLLVLRVTA
jgi:hypothetical protein